MRQDEVILSSSYKASFNVRNTANSVIYYDYWLTKNPENSRPKETSEFYTGGELVLAGYADKTISVRIFNIKPDKLQVYYLCVQERPTQGTIAVVAKVCGKLRLYWPQSELRKLQTFLAPNYPTAMIQLEPLTAFNALVPFHLVATLTPGSTKMNQTTLTNQKKAFTLES